MLMDENIMMRLLKFDLARTGAELGDDAYLASLLRTASSVLERQGIQSETTDEYFQLVVGTAAWMYRKRITGDAEPNYLRRMRINLMVSQRVNSPADSPADSPVNSEESHV